jgi:iron(III) transport system permease protein
MNQRAARLFADPWRVSWTALLGAVLSGCLIALPLIFLVLRASQTGWGKVWTLISSVHVAVLLGNTVILAMSTTFFCALIGVGTAWLVERTALPGRRVWIVLLTLPVALPDFVVGYAWVSLFPSFHGFLAAVLIMTLTLYPLVFLPVAARLRNLDPLLGEIGQSLGLTSFRNFLCVTLPQIRSAVLGGCLLVALGLLAEYGVFEIVRFQTFTTAIFTEFTLGFDTPGACAQSLVLVALGLLILAVEQKARGLGREVRSGPGAQRHLARHPLGRGKVFVLFLLLLLSALSLCLPLFSVVYWLLQGSSSTLPPASIFSALFNTVKYSAWAAAIATILAIPVARLSVRNRSFAGVFFEKLAYLPQAIPGVVIGLCLVFFAINTMPLLYQTPFLLVIAYAILFFPLAVVAVRAVTNQASPRLEEVALSLGVRRPSIFWRVTFPIIFPGLAASFALVFLSASTELTATLLLHPTGAQTLATEFWRYTSEVSYGAAAPYAAFIVTISVLPAVLVGKRTEIWLRLDP